MHLASHWYKTQGRKVIDKVFWVFDHTEYLETKPYSEAYLKNTMLVLKKMLKVDLGGKYEGK